MYKPKLEKDIRYPLEYGLDVFGGKWDSRINRKSYDEIPPRVEYSLTEKGVSVVPILQSICRWAGAYHKEDRENTMLQYQKCDYNGSKA